MKTLKLLGASLAVLAVVACESAEDKAVKFAANAQEYLDEGELQRARLQFANALQADPNNIAALRGAAEVAERQERYAEQLRYLQRLTNLLPEDIPANADLSRLSLLGGEVDQALERADNVLSQQPDNLEALTIKGAALVLQNNLDQASEALEQALAQAPENAEVRNLLAARYLRDEDFQQASDVIEEGLAANPQDQALLVVRLLLSQRRQDVDEMDDTFQRLIDISPDNGFYRERYAEFLIAARQDLSGARQQLTAALPLVENPSDIVGRLIGIIRSEEGDEAAERELEEIIANYESDDLAFAMPSFLCQIGETERCLSELTALSLDENQSRAVRHGALVELGERAFVERELDDARVYAQRVLDENDSDSNALTLIGKIQLAEENVQEAIETLRTALNSDPGKESTQILLGLAYEADDRGAFAEAQLAQAIDRNGLSANLFRAYRGVLLRNGKTDAATDLTLQFAQTSEATPEVQRESAALLLNQGRQEEAEIVARTLLRANPDDVGSAQVLAASLFSQERWEDALGVINGLGEEAQKDIASVRLKTQALSRLERTDELRTYLQQTAEDGEIAGAYALWTAFEQSEGNNDRGLRIAQAGVEAHPEAEPLWVNLYNASRISGNTDGGQAILERGIAAAEPNTTLRNLQSNEYLTRGQRRQALTVLRSLYEEDSLNDLAANNLAALMIDLEGNVEEALQVAQRFEGTEQPYFADTLAWAHYRNGNLEEADTYSALAVAGAPPNAEILYHRGVIAAALGNTDAAREAFTQALEAPGKTENVSDEAIRTALDGL